jgi:hypothetical protein
LPATLGGEQQSGAGARKQQNKASVKRRKKRFFSFDFSPRVTKIEAAVTWGSVKQWA